MFVFLYRERFSDTQQKAILGKSLLPLIVKTDPSWKTGAKEFASFYKTDMPHPRTFDEELVCWHIHWLSVAIESLPASAQETLLAVDEHDFPNVATLLRIVCVLPVTTCSCERSISALDRLKTYNRSTMGQERLNGLALLHIHYDMAIDHNEIVDIFASEKPRRMDLV